MSNLLILYQFGSLSIIAPLANVVLLPMVPYAMLFSALAPAGSMLSCHSAKGSRRWPTCSWPG